MWSAVPFTLEPFAAQSINTVHLLYRLEKDVYTSRSASLSETMLYKLLDTTERTRANSKVFYWKSRLHQCPYHRLLTPSQRLCQYQQNVLCLQMVLHTCYALMEEQFITEIYAHNFGFTQTSTWKFFIMKHVVQPR